jgi:NifB/MoaA-like Fe-S oxidoreductase
MTFDALGNVTIDINKMLSPQAEFERKMHFVDLYNNEMSNFIAENPKVSKKDLYIKSQELKETYTRAARGDSPKTGLSSEKEKRRQELLRKAGK